MKNLLIIAHIILILIFTTVLASAADVTLAWEANTESDLAGYKIYYDIDSGDPYSGTEATEGVSPITVTLDMLADVGNPEFTITGLNNALEYYFVVTAFDTEGLESDYSNEVFTSYEEGRPPASQQNLRKTKVTRTNTVSTITTIETVETVQ